MSTEDTAGPEPAYAAISLRTTAGMKNLLADYAWAQRTTLSQVVNQAMAEFVERHDVHKAVRAL